ncbi:MAG: helix-turn-helix transcriptional regulator [Nitrospinae bacterium]|nr:helix-turn-helix transcriptional regulator [Nitrospinota bacterium]
MIKIHLSRLMGERKIKTAELARELGLSRGTISALYYERAQKIDVAVLNSLCKYFGCTLQDLIEYRPENK